MTGRPAPVNGLHESARGDGAARIKVEPRKASFGFSSLREDPGNARALEG